MAEWRAVLWHSNVFSIPTWDGLTDVASDGFDCDVVIKLLSKIGESGRRFVEHEHIEFGKLAVRFGQAGAPVSIVRLTGVIDLELGDLIVLCCKGN